MLLERDEDIQQLLKNTRRIAIVGISANPARPSHGVALYLMAAGYEIVPVNPGLREVLGLRCYANLDEIDGPIDMVDVFRRSEEVPNIADTAIAIGAKSLWLQLGVINEDASVRAVTAGLAVVVDRCTKIEHARMR